MHLCPRCVSYEIPRICGLQECDWFHGCLSSEEAERRLKRDDSALGDFLIRLSHNEEHGGNHFVLSCRSSPSKVTHVVLIGEAGSWGLSFAKTFQTIQELITETMKGDAIDRAAIADRETVHGSCPSCTMAMANNADLFCCNCGARVRSTEAAIDHYDRAKGHELGLGSCEPSMSRPCSKRIEWLLAMTKEKKQRRKEKEKKKKKKKRKKQRTCSGSHGGGKAVLVELTTLEKRASIGNQTPWSTRNCAPDA
ncbi:uncharacterized protein MONBRDRAFT_35896 [Monosiga brevicollis MX1]|uniref:SH2 domain-containing protein n=1 Tax=Monosiga brevicollis TaxID=81824 RepID=A9USG6_MONBE|nr:uncharacterized protein MONBRDRAFT_35896 [Monosiga brevicollis MX1]EDQ92097.1 predicted protein [Monosiga brevicollis MX1]|eukprot:XP_001743383.1 hypothetical protein [Monosiga brevicollis MX1]